MREYLKALGGGREGPREGHLDEHLQVMPVVTLAADGLTAKARWRGIVLKATTAATRIGAKALTRTST